MVRAVRFLLVCVKLWAAFPVGAHGCTQNVFSVKYSMIAEIKADLPVPGPPDATDTLLVTAASKASICSLFGLHS